MPMQSGDIKDTFADISKSIDMLKFSPKSNIDDGIKKFVIGIKTTIQFNIIFFNIILII